MRGKGDPWQLASFSLAAAAQPPDAWSGPNPAKPSGTDAASRCSARPALGSTHSAAHSRVQPCKLTRSAPLCAGGPVCLGNSEQVVASLHFFDSLSDEQKRLWEEMQSPAAPMAVEPEDSSIFAAAPAPLAPTPDGPFYAPGKAAATVIEVQVIGTLVLLYFRSDVRAAQQWVLNAESDADRVGRCGLDGQVWAPPSSSPTWATHGPVLKPLDTALSVRIGGGEVETAAAVVSTWSGSVGVVTPAQVDAYVVALRASKSKRRIAGPVRNSSGNASPRHVAAIPAVAALLRVSGRVLRDRVAVLATEPTFEPKCSKAELHARVEAAEQQNQVLQQKLTHANQLKSQAQLLAKEKGKMRIADTVAAQVSKVRSRLESEYDDKLLREKARAQGELERATGAIEKKLVQAKRLKTDAHAEKRGERARAEAQSELADTRLGKLKALKDKLAATEAECEELKAQPGADPTEMETLYESQGKVLAMDVWEREARGAGGGKGAKKFGFLWRTTAFAMMSNMTPQSAVVPNVRCVLRAVAPWLSIDEPSSRALTEWRFELRFIEEALAFMEVAGAYSIRMLGFDGTTKFGKPMMTSNVVIEPKKGAPLKAVILRASYLSPDGTAAGEAKTIETKCFARGRDFINRLMRRWVSMHPGLPWPGPEAAALSLARLAGGGALMSDTCPTAEKTKRLLSEIIKEQATEMAREKMGDAWDGLSDEEKEHELRVHLLDCHQHMRNIFLKEMSAAQARHVAEELKPHLDNFSAWERMSTDFTQLLRATYKELHHTQRYYKGKGVEFSAWLLANYPSAFAIHFERADGGRQVTRPPDCGVSDLPAISPQSQPRLARPAGPRLRRGHRDVRQPQVHRRVPRHARLLERPLERPRGLSVRLLYRERVHRHDARERRHRPADLASVPLARWQHVRHVEAYELVAPEHEPRAQLRVHHPGAGGGRWQRAARLVARRLRPDHRGAARVCRVAQLHVRGGDGARPRRQDAAPALQAGARRAPQSDRPDQHRLARQDGGVHRGAGGRRPAQASRHEARTGEARDGARRRLRVRGDGAGARRHDWPRRDQRPAGRVRLWPRRHDHAALPGHHRRGCFRLGAGAVDEIVRVRRRLLAVEPRDAGGAPRGGSALGALGARRRPGAPQGAALSFTSSSPPAGKRARSLPPSPQEHDDYVAHKRKTNSQLELDALVRRYGLALSFFQRWQTRGVRSIREMTVQLAKIAGNQAKLDWLREQCEMRVIGLSFNYKLQWGSSKDEDIGTVEDLTGHLKEILEEEQEAAAGRVRAAGPLPHPDRAAQDVQGAGHADPPGEGDCEPGPGVRGGGAAGAGGARARAA